MAESWKFTPGQGSISSALRPGLVRALKETAETVAARASGTAPRASGRLADSVVVKVDEQRMIAGIGFTDSKAVGAHEEMHAHLDAGKRPKFLELALQERKEDLMRAAEREMRKVFK